VEGGIAIRPDQAGLEDPEEVVDPVVQRKRVASMSKKRSRVARGKLVRPRFGSSVPSASRPGGSSS